MYRFQMVDLGAAGAVVWAIAAWERYWNGDVSAGGQPGAKIPLWNDQIRALEHGTLNFLHTTDTHGWYAGHLNQAQYAGDWGDFVSFCGHLRTQIEQKGADLLVVDTGDRHDGNGLSDLTSVNGAWSGRVFSALDYDLITVGNHELYKADVSELEYNTLVAHYGERFVSTNVKYLNDEGEWVVFGGNTYRYFETPVQGLKVLALSFLFDFPWANERVSVEPIDKVVESVWFDKLMREFVDKPVDVVVVFGHLPVSHAWLEMGVLHTALRGYFPKVAIQYFGGHSHIRDFSVVDDKATGLQSGRYCETVGFLSIKDLDAGSHTSNVFRSYIDFNRHSFVTHTNLTQEEFDTEHGLAVTNMVADMSAQLGLDETYGYIPHSFYTSAADYNRHDRKSLLRFLEASVLTQLESKSCDDTNLGTFNNSRIVLINTGGIRYDMYKGPFTKNSLFTVSPFKNKWKAVANVPRHLAFKLQDILNKGPFIVQGRTLKSPQQLALDAAVPVQVLDQELESSKQSYGYVTHDDFGTDGDDTLHRPLQNYYVPNVIQSYTDNQTDQVDVVYYDFIEPFVLKALKDACGKDADLYLDLVDQVQFYNNCENESNLGQLLKQYVQNNWPKP